MADIDLDDDRIEKLPLWAGQLIYALDKRHKTDLYIAERAQAERDEAQRQLLAHLADTTGPADSDTFAERDDMRDPDDEQATPTPALGLGRGAVVSFGAPQDFDGRQDPSIQARMADGRLVLSTDFGNLALAITTHLGRTAVAVTITD